MQALAEWRYEAELGDGMTPVEQLATNSQQRDVVINFFSGDKLGDDDHLWRCLAPFVTEKGTVAFRGEDDVYWRYLFQAGTCIEQAGRVVWEDPLTTSL